MEIFETTKKMQGTHFPIRSTVGLSSVASETAIENLKRFDENMQNNQLRKCTAFY